MIRRWHLQHNKAHGLAGLSGYYGLGDSAGGAGVDWPSNDISSWSDVGTNVSGSTVSTAASTDWLSSLVTLGTTYLTGQNQQAIAKTVSGTQTPGTVTTYSPTGAVQQSTAAPIFSTSSGLNLSSLLSNPLVLGAIGLGAYLLFKKKK